MAAAAGRRIGGAPPGNTDEDETGDNQSDNDEANEVADLPADQQKEAVRPPAGVGLPPAVLDPARRILLLARAPPAIAPAMARGVPPPPGGYAARQPPAGLPPAAVLPALAGPVLRPVLARQVLAQGVPVIVPPAAPLAAGRVAVVGQQPAAAAPQIPGSADSNFLIMVNVIRRQLVAYKAVTTARQVYATPAEHAAVKAAYQTTVAEGQQAVAAARQAAVTAAQWQAVAVARQEAVLAAQQEVVAAAQREVVATALQPAGAAEQPEAVQPAVVVVQPAVVAGQPEAVPPAVVVEQSAAVESMDVPPAGEVFPPVTVPPAGEVFPPVTIPPAGEVFPPVTVPPAGEVFPPVTVPPAGEVFPPVTVPPAGEGCPPGAVPPVAVVQQVALATSPPVYITPKKDTAVLAVAGATPRRQNTCYKHVRLKNRQRRGCVRRCTRRAPWKPTMTLATCHRGRRHQRASRRPGPGQDKSAVTCYRCRGKGHYARECPSATRTAPAVAPKPTEN